ncbi:uncharacterized protein [Antedon mediterranea]|uniref:uncharacterized protein n=1 Tax=Antedon mediterranea TaxID=105859 RepID=UPI003AF570A1
MNAQASADGEPIQNGAGKYEREDIRPDEDIAAADIVPQEVDDQSVPLFCFMDCEASSGVPYRDDIVEIAVRCWPYKEQVEDSLFYSLIYTSKYLCKFALNHGFTRKLLRNQPYFKKVISSLLCWLKRKASDASQYLNVPVFPVLLCHGGEGFDYLMLFSQLERTGISFQCLNEINLHFADTFPHMEMYKLAEHPLLVDCGSLGLENMEKKWFGPQQDKEFHHAEVDVEAMFKLFTQTPLCTFLQDIPIYNTTDWIEYYNERKYHNEAKRNLAENLPSSIPHIQKKFIIKKLLGNGLDMDGLRKLYEECSEPHHFRQELVDITIKGPIASKLMQHFYSQGLKQYGRKQYIANLKDSMPSPEWIAQNNTTGRHFRRYIANGLPPILPSGGSGFDFDDATEPSTSEKLKDLMRSFAMFQLQMNSEAAVSGEFTPSSIPQHNNFSGEKAWKFDESLPKWTETGNDLQSEVVDNFKPSPIQFAQSPLVLPTSGNLTEHSGSLPLPNKFKEGSAPLQPTPTTSLLPTSGSQLVQFPPSDKSTERGSFSPNEFNKESAPLLPMACSTNRSAADRYKECLLNSGKHRNQKKGPFKVEGKDRVFVNKHYKNHEQFRWKKSTTYQHTDQAVNGNSNSNETEFGRYPPHDTHFAQSIKKDYKNERFENGRRRNHWYENKKSDTEKEMSKIKNKSQGDLKKSKMSRASKNSSEGVSNEQ